MTQSRQLAAIMFTDIVGYTALMGEDEEKAFELLEKNRLIQRPIIQEYNGRWLKEIGDGVLASFNAVSDAVYCAKAIQKACGNEPDLKLRIGIHEGEVVFKGEDVFGDGVNIASRLEPLAPIGGILVSESVHRNLGNKKGIVSTFIREEALKNVKEPIKIYSVQVEGVEPVVIPKSSAAPQQVSPENSNPRKMAFAIAGVLIILLLSYLLYSNFSAQQPLADPPPEVIDKSIAVLPFVNISNDPEQQYFSDGMMEEILNHLVKVGELKVTSRTSVMQYKGTKKPIREIAGELGVAHILEGSVRRSGDKIRITVQLIDTSTDQHLWSETYDRQFTDVFAIQSDVAQNVATVLNARLNPQVIQSMDRVPTRNMEAYDLYLKSLSNYQGINTSMSLNIQRELLLQAIELDSTFSSAYAILGFNIMYQAGFAGKGNAKDIAKEAKDALERAIILNPLDGVAHAMRGAYSLWYERDFKNSEINMLTAQKLAPSDGRPNYHLTDLLLVSGRFEEAIPVIQKSLEAAENNPLAWARLSLVSSFNNDQERMNEAIQRGKLAESVNILAYLEMARAYLIQNQYSNIPAVLNLAPDTKNVPRGMALLAVSYSKLAQSDASDRWLESLIKRSDETSGGSPSFYTAMVYASRDEVDQAFQWLEKSYADNEIELIWLKVEPEFASLYNDPRWQKMLDKVGFPK